MAYGTVNAEQLTTQSGFTLGAGNASSFKNRIINGAMVIDQRNAGASITPINQQYGVDRWQYSLSQTSKLTAQQSSTAPTGFKYSNLITSSSAYSVGASEVFLFRQKIEGYNVADLGWGAVGAQAVTLSFWVRSSLTGTFGGSVRNENQDRSFPFSYTISTANTWEQKTVAVTGDTSGTWATTTGVGLELAFSMGSGSTVSNTAGSWYAGSYASATGATSVVGTNGATFYITGVQFEVGTVATSFDYRSYTTEFSLCQRYFTKFLADDNNGGYGGYAVGVAGSTNRGSFYMVLPVRLRTYPTIAKGGNNRILYSSAGAVSSTSAGVFGNQQFSYNNGYFTVDASAGTPFTTGLPCQLSGDNDSTAYLSFSAEL